MIDAILFRHRIGSYNKGCDHYTHKSRTSNSTFRAKHYSDNSNTNINLKINFVLYCVFLLHIFMLSISMTSQNAEISKQKNLNATSNVNYTVQEYHFKSLSDSLVASAMLTLLTFIVKRVRIFMIGSESGLDSIKRLVNHIMFSYSKSSSMVYKNFRHFVFWSSVLNLVLLLLCNMSIKNPGPAKNLPKCERAYTLV